MSLKRFNIRVYGFLINDQKEVLVSDEYLYKTEFTKFPGGGLEWGEGVKECLVREFKEELNLDIEVGEHFYTTDFFQGSAFNPGDQIISVYYLVSSSELELIPVVRERFGFLNKTEGAQVFRWLKISSLTEADFTFPIDKYISGKLKNSMYA